MIHIAIVEDEDRNFEQILGYIEQFGRESGRRIETVRFRDGEEILEQYRGNYDIILMDIQMPFMNGMEAAEQIRKLDSEVIIMFITNRTDYAIRGYEVNALDYMVKPITYFAFSQKLERAIERIRKKEKHFVTISTPEGTRKVDVEEIYFLESRGHELLYQTKKNLLVTRATMKDAQEHLEAYGFYRCSKGFLVNLAYVEGISDSLCIIGKYQIPISRGKKKEFMDLLMQTLG